LPGHLRTQGSFLRHASVTTRSHVTYIKTTLPDVIEETKQSVHSISRFPCFFFKILFELCALPAVSLDSRNAQGSGATAARVGRIKFYEDKVVTPRKSTSEMQWPGEWTFSNMSSRAREPPTAQRNMPATSSLCRSQGLFCGCAAIPLVFASTGVRA
jgi:hypothetical protein